MPSASAPYVEIATLAANLATAVGVAFAAFQFWSESRRAKAEFTIDRIERVRQYAGPAFIFAARELAAKDGSLPEKEFRSVLALPDRARILDAMAEIGGLMALLEAKRLDMALLAKLRSPANLRVMILACRIYFERIGDNKKVVERWLTKLDKLSPPGTPLP